MRILVTGPQGSGKTTQAQLIAQYLNIPLIDGGEMLRKLAKENSEDGRKVRENIEKGLLAPDDIMGKIIRQRVEKADCQEGLVMDGYPRSLAQLETYDPKFDIIFDLVISDEIGVERLLKRSRADDTPDLIKERLTLYHQLTEPVLNHYQQMGILHQVDGSDSIEEIQAKIRKVIDGRSKR